MRKITVSRTVGLGVVSAVGVLALAACSSSSPSSGSGAANAANAANATTAASVSAPATQAPVSSAPATTQAAAAQDPDPCQMVTSAEAGAMAGATFGPGKEEDFGTGGRGCSYSSPTLRLVTVQTARGTSPAEAQAYWAQEESKVPGLLAKAAQAPPGEQLKISVTPVAGYGDRAAVISGSGSFLGMTFAVGGMYLLKGSTFVGFETLALNHPAPTVAALEAQAKTVLGRM